MTKEEIETSGPAFGLHDSSVWGLIHGPRLEAVPVSEGWGLDSDGRMAGTDAFYNDLVARGFIL